ncbi:MAG: hypothetical protein AAGG51_03290 [Cyanobacteria bacterium P01_G01_bin.54]
MSKEIDLRLSETFSEFLEDTEIRFSHRNREDIFLSDLFVAPDLEAIKESSEDESKIIRATSIFEQDSSFLILGDEQSGKTALAKNLFKEFRSRDLVPILIDGSSLRASNIDNQISRRVNSIYPHASSIDILEQDNLVCIIDDVSKWKIKLKRAQESLISDLTRKFKTVILIADDEFEFLFPDISSLDGYVKFKILPFGYVRRNELIEKWVSLEPAEELSNQEYWSRIDGLSFHVDLVIGKNIVPAKPCFILMFLQSFEIIGSQGLELTAYGHCYQNLIYQSLNRVRVKQTEIDTYLNALSELSGAILNSSSVGIDSSDLQSFFDEYSRKFLPVDQNKIISDLVSAHILQWSGDTLKFRYRYMFYFFAAKNLADSLRKGDQARSTICHLINTIHLERSSHIILFLTHHSKDPLILEEILKFVKGLCSDEEKITLEEEKLNFLQDFIRQIPEIVLESRDARQERLSEAREKDWLEQQSSNDTLQSDDEDLSDFVSKVNKILRATEVCGQILRNRFGSLERANLESIYGESLMASLRLMSILIKFMDRVKERAIREIDNVIDKNPRISNNKIAKQAEHFYKGLHYLLILAVLYKTSYSLGSSKGRDIYLTVTNNDATPAALLVQEIIELQFEKKLDINKISKLYLDFSKNPVCIRLLKEIVLRHCYMHDVGYKERQQISNKLNIPISTMTIQHALSGKGRKG